MLFGARPDMRLSSVGKHLSLFKLTTLLQQFTNANEEFVGAEGLAEKVIGAALHETGMVIFEGEASSEQYGRRILEFAFSGQTKFEAADIRQHHVQNSQINIDRFDIHEQTTVIGVMENQQNLQIYLLQIIFVAQMSHFHGAIDQECCK